MKRIGLLALACAAAAVPGRGAEEVFDRIEDALTTSAFDGRLRARLSGTLDLEGYAFQSPTPALLETAESSLFAPRLSLFLDAQLGSRAYVFVQARADRGFDPRDEPVHLRLDEYALRFAPWGGRGRLTVQVGKFATIVGNWTARHSSWTNPFVSAPLLYENLTGVWDSEALRSANTLLQWSHARPGLPAHITAIEKSLRIPIIWGPSYSMGVAVAGDVGRLRYAFELKHAPLSSRPETWHHTDGHWSHPTASGRIGYRPNQMWNVGLSASGGSYLLPAAAAGLGGGRSLADYRQLTLAQDLSFAWHHFQLWTEIFASRFEIPNVGDAETVAYYAEAKYKFTPHLFGALRWNQQLFGNIPERGGRVRWGRDTSRVDVGFGYRFTAHTQLKLQFNWQRGDVQPRDEAQLAAAQFTVRF